MKNTKTTIFIFLVAILGISTIGNKVQFTQNINPSKKIFLLLNENLSEEKKSELIQLYNLKLFSKIKSDFFNRLYVLESSSHLKQLKKFGRKISNSSISVSLSTIEKDIKNTFSKKDELSGFQYAHFYKDQNILTEEFDDTIISKRISPLSSIGANNIINRLDRNFKRDIIVAVLDTGIDTTHPDINFYRGEDCNDQGAIPIVDPIDKDQNGKAGDCSGWDFTRNKGRLNLPEDDSINGHGTHIAGIISSKIGNGGLSGLSNRIKVLPLKVIKRKENLIGSAVTFPDIVARAIEYAIEKNVDIINMSYGWASTVDSEVIQEMIKIANSRGIFVIAAAGNDSNNLDFFPCNHIGVLCVGSSSPFQNSRNQIKISDFSNYGGIVDIFAPGEAVLSTYPRSADSADKVFDQRGYNYLSGTSQSAPFIALALSVVLGLETNTHLYSYPSPIAEKLAIQARLIKTSGAIAPGKKWASGGLVHLERLLKSKDANYIAPDLKNIPVIRIDENQNFKFSIPIQNFSKKMAENIIIKLSAPSDEIIFKHPKHQIKQIAPSSKKALFVNGEISSLDIDFRQVINIEISSTNFAKKFKKELVFGNIGKSRHHKRILISEREDIPFMLRKRRGLYANRINKVYERHNDNSNSNLYFTKIDKRNGNKKLVVLNIENNQIQKIEYKLPDNISSSFFNFIKVDLNYDREKDYLLGVLIEHSEEEKSQGAKDFIEFHYLDAKLKPLYTKHIVEFRPEISAITGFRNINLYPFKRKDGSKMAIPTYIFNGGIHESDLPKKPWLKQKEPFRKLRIYYTELDEEQMVLKERVINTYEFEQKLRKNNMTNQSAGFSGVSYRARFFESILPLAFGEQNKDLFYRGENKVYLSIGFANNQKSYEMTLNKAKVINIREISFQGDTNLTKSTVTNIKNPYGNSKDFFSTYLESGNVELIDPEKEFIRSFKFRGQDYRGLKASFFDKQNNPHLLFEFGDHFKLFGPFDNNRHEQYSLGRVSFINGVVFKELTQKIDILRGNEFEGALYVDSSAITRGNVFVLKFKQGKLLPSIKNNLYLKKGCIPIFPTNLNSQTYFTSICEDLSDGSEVNEVIGDVYLELTPIR